MTDNTNQHIKPQWAKLAAYLQHEARKTQGFAILSDFRILVDGNGNPIQWTEVNMTKLMPKAECNEAFPKLMMLGDKKP
jgi:hypothetical protein